MTRFVLALVVLALVAGCGGEETDAASTSGGGGGPSEKCAPGELAIDDGSCRPAGLPPDLPPAGPSAPPQPGVSACHEGFVSDGEGGCTAILPAAPCPSGTMAIPGDSACREVAPCGSGTWGLIPIEPGAEFVDASFTGPSDGTMNAPWKTVQEAIDAAAPGDLVAIAAGIYDENLVIAGKAVRLWGVCPALVEITGLTPMGTAIEITALGSEVHTLALTGVGRGVDTNAPGGVLLDRLWIHDADSAGVYVAGGGEATEVVDSLIERTSSAGILVEGSTIVIERTEVNDPQYWTDGYRGMSVHMVPDPDTDAPSTATISQCHFHDSKDFGIASYAGALQIAGTLVRNTASTSDPQLGWGVFALHPASSTSIEGSVFASNTSTSVALSEGTATISNTTIESTEASPEDGYGSGVVADLGFVLEMTESTVRDSVGSAVGMHGAEAHLTRVLIQRTAPNLLRTYGSGTGLDAWEFERPATVELDECVVEESFASGVFVWGSDVTMRESIVRATHASPSYTEGIGVAAHRTADTGRVATMSMTHSLVEESTGYGVTAYGGRLEIVSSIVRDTRPDAVDEVGLGVALSPAPAIRSQGRIYGSIIEQSHYLGIGLNGADLDVEATVIRDVSPQASTNTLGRGVHVEASDAEGRSSLAMRWSLIEGVHESGIFGWSADIDLQGVLVRDVGATPASGGIGFGVAATAGPAGVEPSRVVIVGSRVERTLAAGIISSASEVSVTGTLVTDIAARQSDGHFGYGTFAQEGGRVDIADSLVERTINGGIGFVRSSGSVQSVTVRDVTSTDGWLGDGILIAQADVTLRDVLVERPKRAGVSAFAANVTMSGVDLLCAAIDVDVEAIDAVGSQFMDQGDNRCGCPAPDRACVAVSAGVAPPEAIGSVN